MGVLIDELLRFSQLSRTPLNKQQVNTGKLVGNVLESLNFQREGRQVDIRIGELPECKGDAGLLNQVWVNLISNALKYTCRRETAVIEIGCKLEHDEKGCPRIWTRQDGTPSASFEVKADNYGGVVFLSDTANREAQADTGPYSDNAPALDDDKGIPF